MLQYLAYMHYGYPALNWLWFDLGTFIFCFNNHNLCLIWVEVSVLLSVAHELHTFLAEFLLAPSHHCFWTFRVSTNSLNLILCFRFVACARQLAKALEVPLVNDLGYTKRYVRCLQVILSRTVFICACS